MDANNPDQQYEAIDSSFGTSIAEIARMVAQGYRDRGVTYIYGSDASGQVNGSDCSHFVHDVLNQSGLSGIPYTSTSGIRDSTYFVEVAAEEALAGDVIVQGSHMGIYTGTVSANGNPIGTQMGNHGACDGLWGPGGWFAHADDLHYFRPLKIMG